MQPKLIKVRTRKKDIQKGTFFLPIPKSIVWTSRAALDVHR
jgi:hypothetical protein